MKAGLRVLYVAIGHIAPVLTWMMKTMKQHSPANFAKNSKGFAIPLLARWGYPVLPYLEGKMGTLSCPHLPYVLTEKSRYHCILGDFPEITRPAGTLVIPKHTTDHHIRTTPGPPVTGRPRRLDPKRLQIAKKEFENKSREGTARKSESPWSSPLHLAPKKNDGWRPCGDYTGLNTHTIADRYPFKTSKISRIGLRIWPVSNRIKAKKIEDIKKILLKQFGESWKENSVLQWYKDVLNNNTLFAENAAPVVDNESDIKSDSEESYPNSMLARDGRKQLVSSKSAASPPVRTRLTTGRTALEV
ncbi:hypothetical protein EVAR_99888_1 [Eumeta japonica]|uniref:Uncharacterized protein n=1 Tax=Eumeta variegata TaxID=151549 RepID=A0A4C1ZG89_EUMVA|nr:hypothetical protein EVAR_99888_1 [Eumeta japonica]